MKHMADLQQSVVSDIDTKQQINNQIVQWEENLERLHCEQFRLRCYMASLQSGELPNPKVSAFIETSAPRKRNIEYIRSDGTIVSCLYYCTYVTTHAEKSSC